MTNIPLILFPGTLSTSQTQLARAPERQGIEVFEQVKARLQKSGHPAAGRLKKPVIYSLGFMLNSSLFAWSTLAGYQVSLATAASLLLIPGGVAGMQGGARRTPLEVSHA